MTPREEIELIEADRRVIEAGSLSPSLSGLLRLGADRYPQQIALREIDGQGRALTYRNLNGFVWKIVALLSSHGVERGTHVAIALPNCVEIIAIWIALSRMGAVAVGVNPSLTEKELEYILETSDSEFLVLDAGRQDWVSDWAGFRLPSERIIVVGSKAGQHIGQSFDAALAEQGYREPPVATPDIDMPASILYTSGSSGRPKPALLPHRWHTMMGHVRSLQGPRIANLLIENPIYYMGGQWRLAMALTQGATVLMASKPTLNHFAERLTGYEVQFSSLPNLIAKRPDFSLDIRSRLKWMACCALPKELHVEAERRLRAPIREIYGSTEMGSTIVMPTRATSMVGSGSVGLPAAFRSCRIVDTLGNEVSRGSVGELQVRGPGMLSGYYKSPGASADAFDDAGWFKTGDLFRQDSDGYYFWVARAKDVIRRSNENISATELEEEVARLAGILEVAAVPVPDDYRGEEVKLYIRLQPGFSTSEVPPKAILEHCRGRLATYKLPRYIEYVDEFPLTVSLKISKPDLKKAKPDLRVGSFDLAENLWR
ncbi:long-chain fatty acid--CoA ligase [Mesorhizobium sp. M2D.F.Ca.ET.185.01.1.1]|uniref:class I adenylate-forming enzyme family protein n=2 Tax=Mesorhizobium TaxID=68287 RepID=UPI000FCAE2EF|nr:MULTISPECIES: class I adenylate-forming enzyme family protein [unclassified Mesorhizobium]TGP77347.1 long-chain fatty acid--CoA ligase [bacterium M00.F.Ca.ET.227.01.1.1]TGP93141.1 long-chain fatty acid--CoA ligase [bacterium M00.F.Ca.ET.222.01.1.1]TGP96687.1 long-chain fatty acid--CoA ligase [bacterium M00.F.Ca.ET.221.01.1.1]TGT95036.1 long-chain fatty acid--CoA ligase [bacterium M00.F.Ca.ET.163.01.1.1]TGU18456.1 long-chain fatty acid--CoA ligase [bacterium M00.F.Ca.ET.156.01.1.1]TGU49899.